MVLVEGGPSMEMAGGSRRLGRIATAFTAAAVVPGVLAFFSLRSTATPPEPTYVYGTTVVDGDRGEWNVSGPPPTDFFTDMIRAGGQGGQTTVLSKAYLRYDCSRGTLYALVLTQPHVRIQEIPSDNWIKILDLGHNTLVDGGDGNDGTPPDFSYVRAGGHTVGWEASLPLPNPASYDHFVIHAQVKDAMGKSQTSSSPKDGIPLAIDCPPPQPLSVSKTATPSFTRTYLWRLSKTADREQVSTDADTATVGYTLTAEPAGFEDSGWAVAGQIEIENANPYAIEDVTVTESLDGVTCEIRGHGETGGGGNPRTVTVPAEKPGSQPELVLDYSCAYGEHGPASYETENHVQITWPVPGPASDGSSEASAPVTFGTGADGNPSRVGFEGEIRDPFAPGGSHGTWSYEQLPRTFSYTRDFPVPPEPDCETFTNEAVLWVDGTQTDTTSGKVSVAVCRTPQNLILTKTATPTFTRTFDWAIAKRVVGASKISTSQDTAGFTHAVDVTRSSGIDSAWRVTGEIVVANPNPYAVQEVTLADGVNDGGACAVAGADIGELAGGARVTRTYECTYPHPPAAPEGGARNTATVTWVGGPADGDQQTARVEVPFSFVVPTTLIRSSVRVTDAFDGASPLPLGGGLLADSAAFVHQEIAAVPASGCHAHANTATLTAADEPAYTRSADAVIEACRLVPQVSIAPAGRPSTRLRIRKRASMTASAPATVTYTIVVTNLGKVSARGVIATDTVPAQMFLVRRVAGMRMRNGLLTWSLGTLAPGRSRTVRVRLRADPLAAGRRCDVARARASNTGQVTDRACVRLRAVPRRVGPSVTG
jgi:uncharacterized repeat protein (TIGR01451 family)